MVSVIDKPCNALQPNQKERKEFSNNITSEENSAEKAIKSLNENGILKEEYEDQREELAQLMRQFKQ